MSRRRLAVFALLAGLSSLVVAMVAARVAYTGNSDYTNLVWNLFLAWIPFAIAIYVYEGYQRSSGRVRLWAAGAFWLVFFPNAAYIVTDFKWLRVSTGAPIWYDIVLLTAAAWCGLLLGFISLYLIQAVVRDALGPLRAWAFVMVTLALGSFGVYLGRIQRWNSWDVFTQPDVLAHNVVPHLAHPEEHPKALAGMVLFTAFLGATYLAFYSLARFSATETPDRQT